MNKSLKKDSDKKQKIKWIKAQLKWLAMYFVLYLFPQFIPYFMEKSFPPKEVNGPVEHIIIDTDDVVNGISFNQPRHGSPPQERRESPLLDDHGLLYNSVKYPQAEITVEFEPSTIIGNNGSNSYSSLFSKPGASLKGTRLDFRDLYWEVHRFAPLKQLPSLSELEQTAPSVSPSGEMFSNDVKKDQMMESLPNEQFTFDPKIFEAQERLVPHDQYAPNTENCFNVEPLGNSSDWCTPETLVF